MFDFFGLLDHHDHTDINDLSSYHYGVPDYDEFHGTIFNDGHDDYLQIGDSCYPISYMDELGKYQN